MRWTFNSSTVLVYSGPVISREQIDGALIRRAGWSYPAGITVQAEVWPASTDPAVVTIFSADDFAPIMEVRLAWGDVVDIDVYPAIGLDDGLRVGAEIMSRRPSEAESPGDGAIGGPMWSSHRRSVARERPGTGHSGRW